MGDFVAIQSQDERLATGQQSSDGELTRVASIEEEEPEKPEGPQEAKQVANHDGVSKISSAIRNNESNQIGEEEADCASKWWRRTRIHVALLGLAIAVVNCYAQATFCIAIVEMVLPADYVDTRANQAATLSNVSRQALDKLASLVLEDQSCPIEFKYRDYYDSWRFDSNSSSSTTTAGNQNENQQSRSSEQVVDTSNRFDWDASQQGLLLGAFAVGTAPLQIIGGRMAEIYGSKWVLLMACIGTGLTNLAIPHLAHFNLFLLIANRILMGVAQAGMEPGLMCLLADWLTPQEAGFFISMLLFALCLGFFLGSLCSSFFLALGYGWPLTYYVCGGLNLLVALIWYLYADSWPRASKHISRQELAYIEREQARAKKLLRADGGTTQIEHLKVAPSRPTDHNQMDNSGVQEDPLKAPWINILSSRPVWAFIICKISIRWCADVISNELPTYLANVLHLSIKINGLLNSVSCALFAISSFLTGWLATSNMFNAPAKTCCSPRHHLTGITSDVDRDNKCLECHRNQQQANTNKTNLRRCFQSLASFGSAVCLILMTRYDCDILISMSCLLLLSWFIVMGTGGELQIAYDMTSRYPGTLHGMACTLSVSGWLAPPLYGLILGDQPSSRSRWSLVWYSTAAINVLGGLVFVLFADASPQDFDRPRKSDRKRSELKDLEGADKHDGSYCNGALSGSSCESSPKSTHQASKQIKPGDKLTAFQPIFTTFDCDQPIRCRQLESSFTRSANPLGGRLDSPLWLEADDLIYPYCEKRPAKEANGPTNPAHHQKGSIWQRLASLLTQQRDKAKLNSKTSASQPPRNSMKESIRRLADGQNGTINQSRGSHEGQASFRLELECSGSDEFNGRRLIGKHPIESETAAPGPPQPYSTLPSACATTGSADGGCKDQRQDSNTLLPMEATCQKTITHL